MAIIWQKHAVWLRNAQLHLVVAQTGAQGWNFDVSGSGLTQKGPICRIRDTEQKKELRNTGASSTNNTDDVAVLLVVRLTVVECLKARIHSHHQVERWRWSQADCWLKEMCSWSLLSMVQAYGICLPGHMNQRSRPTVPADLEMLLSSRGWCITKYAMTMERSALAIITNRNVSSSSRLGVITKLSIPTQWLAVIGANKHWRTMRMVQDCGRTEARGIEMIMKFWWIYGGLELVVKFWYFIVCPKHIASRQYKSRWDLQSFLIWL